MVSWGTGSPRVCGFGTAHLMGRIGRRESIRLIHAAVDSGITHFDTARVYGFGDTEGMLGEALKRRDVAIYTKAGQGNSRFSWTQSKAHDLGRPIARVRAELGRLQSREVGAAVKYVRRTSFSPDYLRESVHTSLKLLRRETLDGLLLHEVTAEELTPELLEVMSTLIEQGKIVRFGVASEPRATAEIGEGGFPGQIVQQSGGPFLEPVHTDRPVQMILHSLFGTGAANLVAFLSWLDKNPVQRDQIMSVVDAESAQTVPALLLGYTAARWPGACIVFSSKSEKRIMDNAYALRRAQSDHSVRVVSRILETYNLTAHRGTHAD